MESHSSDLPMSVVAYHAPSVEYGALGSGGKRKAEELVQATTETGRVQCCVKAKPWDLTLGSDHLDFRNVTLSAVLLLHDAQTLVETRLGEPLVFTVRPSAADGKTCFVEVRVGVLSSQMEGALFCIRFTAQAQGLTASCLTEPIRVVSKKSQLEKAPPKRSRTSQVATRDAVLTLIDKLEEDDSATVLARISKQNDRILALLGRNQKRKGRSSSEDDDDSSVFVPPAQPAVRSFVAAYAQDRTAFFNDFNQLSDIERKVFVELAAAVLPSPSNAADSIPFSPPPPFPDFRFGKSLDNLRHDLLFEGL